jgi:hypothetical protein
MVFSADETMDVGRDTASPASDDYDGESSVFTGTVNWVQIDLGEDAEDLDHVITPEERLRVAMARQSRNGESRRDDCTSTGVLGLRERKKPMTTTISTPGLSDEQLAELLALTKGADTVELKLTVPVSDRSGAGAALGVDPLDGEIRQVYFFDTPDLALNKKASSFALAASSGRVTTRS